MFSTWDEISFRGNFARLQLPRRIIRNSKTHPSLISAYIRICTRENRIASVCKLLRGCVTSFSTVCFPSALANIFARCVVGWKKRVFFLSLSPIWDLSSRSSHSIRETGFAKEEEIILRTTGQSFSFNFLCFCFNIRYCEDEFLIRLSLNVTSIKTLIRRILLIGNCFSLLLTM